MKNLKIVFISIILVFCLSSIGCIPQNKSSQTQKEEKNEKSQKNIDERKNSAEDSSKTNTLDKNTEKNNNNENLVDMLKNVEDLKVYTIKGPTALSLSALYKDLSDNITITSSPEEIVKAIKKDEADVYFIPSNLFAKLVNSDVPLTLLSGNVSNVLRLMGNNEITPKELTGKTIVLTGRGAIPDVIIKNLLAAYEIKEKDVNLVYINDPSEAAAIYQKNNDALLLLPEPFATALTKKIEGLKDVLDVNKAWENKMLPKIFTSVIVTKFDTFKEKAPQITSFIKSYKKGIDLLYQNPEKYADSIDNMNIVKSQIAISAFKNIEFLNDDDDIIEPLNSFFELILKENPELIGGKMPKFTTVSNE